MKRPKLKKAESGVEEFDFEQGSEEWKAVRCGIPTASRFGDLMAGGEGKMRAAYLYELVGERISGEPAVNYSNKYMDRGREWEPEARDAYEMIRGVEVRRVGFVRNGMKGASPDALVGSDGGLEIKTLAPHLMAILLDRGTMGNEHLAQVHGNIWVCDRRWWDVMFYSRGFPPFLKTVLRDEQYIARFEIGVSAFFDDVLAAEKRIRSYTGSRR